MNCGVRELVLQRLGETRHYLQSVCKYVFWGRLSAKKQRSARIKRLRLHADGCSS